MIARGRLGRLKIFAIVPLFVFVFWLSAGLASGLVGTVVVGVDVHALNLPGYTGSPSERPAPLSLTISTGGTPEASVMLGLAPGTA